MKSKMQEIIDRAENGLKSCGQNEQDAIRALIDAVKLLSRGQSQIMGDINDARRSRTDIPIGGSS